MLLRNVILLIHIPLQRREDTLLPQQVFPTLALHLQERIIRNPLLVRASAATGRGYGEVLQLLAQYDDGLLCQERVRIGCEFAGRA